MANFHIVFDEKDPELGEYFEACKSSLTAFISDNLAGTSVAELGAAFDVNALDLYLGGINQANYIFVAYSHGDDSSLSRLAGPYVSSKTNSHLLVNSLCYTVACLSANDLGPDIIQGGGHIFIGYSGIFKIPLDYLDVSINCANRGLQMFILGQRVGESFESMKAFYTTQIDRLMQFGAVMAAAWLTENREALVLLGNADLTIGDFT